MDGPGTPPCGRPESRRAAGAPRPPGTSRRLAGARLLVGRRPAGRSGSPPRPFLRRRRPRSTPPRRATGSDATAEPSRPGEPREPGEPAPGTPGMSPSGPRPGLVPRRRPRPGRARRPALASRRGYRSLLTSKASRSFRSPVLIRVLAVPRGIRSISPISRAVLPKNADMRTARRCSSGSRTNACRTRSESSARTPCVSGSVRLSARRSISTLGSTGSCRRSRRASRATFRGIARSQVITRPRAASKVAACHQARKKLSCATSSARFGSPRIVTARPNTRPWNRRTNAAELSGSLEARPASRDSSESDLTATHTAQVLGWIALMDLSWSVRHRGRIEERRPDMDGRLRGATRFGLVGLAIMLATVGSAEGASRSAARPIRLDDATMIVEINATDGDAGLQVFLDGEPWRRMTLTAPNGRQILAVNTKTRLRNHGLTELFSESSEPSFKELPLGRFKRLFPEGRYTFRGVTIEGDALVGGARLSHDFPDGPRIVAPADGSTVPVGAVVADWDPAPEPTGINVVGYRAIVEREVPLRVFSVDLPASMTSVTVPAEFIEPGTEYKLEVQAIEASGNQTLTEVSFRVA